MTPRSEWISGRSTGVLWGSEVIHLFVMDDGAEQESPRMPRNVGPETRRYYFVAVVVVVGGGGGSSATGRTRVSRRGRAAHFTCTARIRFEVCTRDEEELLWMLLSARGLFATVQRDTRYLRLPPFMAIQRLD